MLSIAGLLNFLSLFLGREQARIYVFLKLYRMNRRKIKQYFITIYFNYRFNYLIIFF